MEKTVINDFKAISPLFIKYPNLWSNYDKQADVLYVNFSKPAKKADNTIITDDDIILRYMNNNLIGLTFLHVSEQYSMN